MNSYQQSIVDFYTAMEGPLQVAWNIQNSLAIHYGYWDEKVKSFPESLRRMNEVMAETAKIKQGETVLDAGCGVGGSSIYLAKTLGCKAVGVTLSAKQVSHAFENAKQHGVSHLTDFKVMNYSQTEFPDQSFDIVWGCESICYADDKEQFVKEAYRVLKPGGRLIIADGMVTKFENNENPTMRRWLEGWAAKYIETPERFTQFMKNAGFTNVSFRDITPYVMHSSRRMNLFYYPAKLYHLWFSLIGKELPLVNRLNIDACRYQYLSFKKNLWLYGILCAEKK